MAKKQRRKPHFPAVPRKKWWFPILSGLVLAALALCMWVFSSPFPRLEIAGFRITREEYLRAMYQARNDVLSEHAAAGISLKDWNSETPLGDPRRLTMERALQLLSEYYAVGTLAVERGYLADASYDAMLRDMEDINHRRQEALDTGAVITGLPGFTTDDYIAYRASNIRLQFCQDPENPETQVTQEALRQRYEADRDELYQQPDSLELRFLLADAADDELERAFEALREKALETGDLSLALEQMPELKEYYQEISVTPATYSVYARSHADVLNWAADLQAGALSRVFRQADRLCLVQCMDKTVHPYLPLEDVQSLVAQSIRESRYEALVEARMENIRIEGDLNRLYRFTAEQFR